MSYVMPFLPTILVKFVTVRSASPYGTAVGPLGTGGNDAGNTTFIVRSHANIKDLGSIIMLSFPRRSLVQESFRTFAVAGLMRDWRVDKADP